MALKLSCKVRGVDAPACYWRLVFSTIDYNTRQAVAVFSAYFNEDTRQADIRKNVLEQRSFTLKGGEFDTYMMAGDIREQCYRYVKSQEFFSKADDV